MRRDAARDRHQVGLVSAGAMQQHQGRAVRVRRPVEPMNEGEVAGRKPLLAGHGELRQHRPQIFRATGLMRRQKQGLPERVGASSTVIPGPSVAYSMRMPAGSRT
jgi:hypothetical protein